ncbi:MAG TPA: hypothetical protein VNA66_05560 [Gammaproteobacteria bacterium]|nr:hypothetical protein [Gammaproteobacteria bacterium]
MSEVALVVGGKRYGGWKSIRITRSIESIAGSFALDVSDRWDGEQDPWPIAEEDSCRVEIDGEAVIDGYVDARDHSASESTRALSYTGRDRAAALVDNSLVLKQWTYRNVTLLELATALAKPWNVKVSAQAGLTLKKRGKVVIDPGDTAFEVLAREAAEDGVMLVSDGAGGVLITQSGTARATSLVERHNIKAASVKYDGASRYHRYVVTAQAAGSDEAAGNATRIQAEAIDEGVRRTDRVLLIRPDKGYSAADAKRRADWEARHRAASAETVLVTVLDWKQSNGSLWPLNALTRVRAPRLIGVDGDLAISQVDHTISEGGQITQLRLVRPDAFTPEPKGTVKSSAKSEGGWKELKEGGL